VRLQSPAVKKLWKTPPNGRREAHSEPYMLLVRHVVAPNFSCGPLPGAVCVALPWIILYFGGLDLYLYVLVGFALIMMFLIAANYRSRAELESNPQSKELRKTALSENARAAES
jgi:hypothetical protein